jgi:hypothetical protein
MQDTHLERGDAKSETRASRAAGRRLFCLTLLSVPCYKLGLMDAEIRRGQIESSIWPRVFEAPSVP